MDLRALRATLVVAVPCQTGQRRWTRQKGILWPSM